MSITGAGIVISMLEELGVDNVAGIPGGSNLPLYDELLKSTKINHILAGHEQGAGFIAQGYARSTGKTGVCFATSGPGATNLITPLADAMMDSVPLVAITGQVPENLMGTDAFQEIDTFGISVPVTKHNYLVRNINDLAVIIREAFHLASSGRPGPVLIDIPRNIQTDSIDRIHIPGEITDDPESTISEDMRDEFFGLLKSSQRPLIIAGAGLNNEKAAILLQRFIDKYKIPVVTTFRGMGALPRKHPLYLGMAGMHGSTHSNMAVSNSDLIIAIGARFDDRLIGNPGSFQGERRIIHVEWDRAEIGKIIKANLAIHCEASEFLNYMLTNDIPNMAVSTERYLHDIESIKSRADEYHSEYGNADHPASIIKKIAGMVDHERFLVTDVGQHQMWSAQAYPFQRPGYFLTSGGLGTMGFGLPAAIGAAIANPDTGALLITGDGSILMNIQELAVLARTGASVKIILLDNSGLGMVGQQQRLFFEGRLSHSTYSVSTDYAAIAKGFGIEAYHYESLDDESVRRVLNEPGPALLQIPIPQDYLVFPAIPPGREHHEMIVDNSGGRVSLFAS